MTPEKDTERFIVWRAECCDSIRISDRWRRHSMNKCGCGRTAVDAEREYVRIQGEVKMIGRTDILQKAEKMREDARND